MSDTVKVSKIGFWKTIGLGLLQAWLFCTGAWTDAKGRIEIKNISGTVFLIIGVLWLWRNVTEGLAISGFGFGCFIPGAIADNNIDTQVPK